MRISPLLFQGVACLFMSWSEVNWKSLSGVWLFATPWTIWVHGILQTRILEWVAYLFSSGSSRPRNWTGISCIAGRFSTNWAIREARSWAPRAWQMWPHFFLTPWLEWSCFFPWVTEGETEVKWGCPLTQLTSWKGVMRGGVGSSDCGLSFVSPPYFSPL